MAGFGVESGGGGIGGVYEGLGRKFEVFEWMVESFELGFGSLGIGGGIEEMLGDSGEEEVGLGLDFLGERGDLARRAAKAVKSGVHLEVEAGDSVLGGGGGLVVVNCGG